MRETHKLGSDKFRSGDHWMVCDECGFDYRRSEMQRRWDNAWVCKKDYEPRHPQESVRGKADKTRVDVSRPPTTGGDIDNGTPTVGDGWTNNTNGTFTSDGTEATSNVTWTHTIDTDAYYELSIRVTDGGATGTVKAVVGDIETTAITTGYAIAYGSPASGSTVGLVQASNWTGTVWVKIRKVITASDL